MGEEAEAQRSDMTCSASHSHLVVKVQLKRAVLAFLFLLQLRDTAPSSTSFRRMGWPSLPLLCGAVKTYGACEMCGYIGAPLRRGLTAGIRHLWVSCTTQPH